MVVQAGRNRDLDADDRQRFEDLLGLHPKQMQAIAACQVARNRIVCYGGAGGGGKSHLQRAHAIYANLRAAMNGLRNPRFVLASTTYQLLADRLINRFHTDYEQWGKVTENRIYGLHFRFHQRELGIIAFRNLDDPNKYRGTEANTGAGIDESTELPETIKGVSSLATLLYPLRAPQWDGPIPLLLTCNPDGPGFSWHHNAFVLRRDFQGYDPSRFVYLPATHADNPSLDFEAYCQQLAGFPDWLRTARLTGRWIQPAGAVFGGLNVFDHQFSYQKLFPYGIPPHWRRVIGVDYGLRAPYCALWFAFSPSGDIFCYREDYKAGLGAFEQANRIVSMTGDAERIDAIHCDQAMWQTLPQHDGVPNKSVISDYRRVLKASNRMPEPSPGNKRDKHLRIAFVKSLIDRNNDFPNLYIEESCSKLWSELIGAVYDTSGKLAEKREQMDATVADHAIDALSHALDRELRVQEFSDENYVEDFDTHRARLYARYADDAFEQLVERNRDLGI